MKVTQILEEDFTGWEGIFAYSKSVIEREEPNPAARADGLAPRLYSTVVSKEVVFSNGAIIIQKAKQDPVAARVVGGEPTQVLKGVSLDVPWKSAHPLLDLLGAEGLHMPSADRVTLARERTGEGQGIFPDGGMTLYLTRLEWGKGIRGAWRRYLNDYRRARYTCYQAPDGKFFPQIVKASEDPFLGKSDFRLIPAEIKTRPDGEIVDMDLPGGRTLTMKPILSRSFFIAPHL